MKRAKERAKVPNYIKKLRYLVKIGTIPLNVETHMIDVEHDNWCAIFKGKPCNCDPTIKLKASLASASRN
jgi:hypothetical protein